MTAFGPGYPACSAVRREATGHPAGVHVADLIGVDAPLMRPLGANPGGCGMRGSGSLEGGSSFGGAGTTSVAGVGLAALRYGTAARAK